MQFARGLLTNKRCATDLGAKAVHGQVGILVVGVTLAGSNDHSDDRGRGRERCKTGQDEQAHVRAGSALVNGTASTRSISMTAVYLAGTSAPDIPEFAWRKMGATAAIQCGYVAGFETK